MPASLALFLRTLVIGIVVAAPVGAMGVLCIQRVLARGWRAGLATGVGIATADGIYAGLAVFGVTVVSQSLVALQAPLRVGGGIVLLWFGWRAMATPPSHEAARAAESTRFGALYASAVGLTLANPMTIIAFAAVFAAAGLVAQRGVGAAAVATVGVASGSLGWWIVLTVGTALARHTAGNRLLTWVNRLSGVMIAGFGIATLVTGVAGFPG